MQSDDKRRQTLEKCTKAIQKAVGYDTPYYRKQNPTTTANALWTVRMDNIYTNLNNELTQNENIKIIKFKAGFWKHILIVDSANKMFFTVCTKETLMNLINRAEKRSRHYTQIFLSIINTDESLRYVQGNLFGMETSEVINAEDFKDENFIRILKRNPSCYKGYQYWIIAYKAVGSEVSEISMKLLDKNYNLVQNISLMDYLKPDFAELTSAFEEEGTGYVAKDLTKGIRSLISVKSSLKNDRQFKENLSSETDTKPEIRIKEMEKIRKFNS